MEGFRVMDGVENIDITKQEFALLCEGVEKLLERSSFRLNQLLSTTSSPIRYSPSFLGSNFIASDKFTSVFRGAWGLANHHEDVGALGHNYTRPFFFLKDKLFLLEKILQDQCNCFDSIRLQLEKELSQKDDMVSALEIQNSLYLSQTKTLEDEKKAILIEMGNLRGAIAALETAKDNAISLLNKKQMGSNEVLFNNLKKTLEKERIENKWLASECIKLREKVNLQMNRKDDDNSKRMKELEHMLTNTQEEGKKWKNEADRFAEENTRMKNFCVEKGKELLQLGNAFEAKMMKKECIIKDLASSLATAMSKITELESELEKQSSVEREKKAKAETEMAMGPNSQEPIFRTETSDSFDHQEKKNLTLLDLFTRANTFCDSISGSGEEKKNDDHFNKWSFQH